MDGERFDRMVRLLADGALPRRRVLRGLLGGAVVGLLGVRDAAARCKRAGELCTGNIECCSSDCRRANGQRIGNRCPRGYRCSCEGDGGWGTQCDEAPDCERRFGPAPWRCDRGWCYHACGAGRCTTAQVCLDPGDGPRCWYRCDNDGGRCYLRANAWSPQGLCDRGLCYPFPYPGAWCHDRGPECRGGAVCSAPRGGQGTCACPRGQTQCGQGKDARCRALRTDIANCGGCGVDCRAVGGTDCQDGRCICKPWQTQCGSGGDLRCRALQTDPANCGSCGNACQAGTQDCIEGRCYTREGAACPAGCGPGNTCAGCRAGMCRFDGTCGPLTECLPEGAACPGGCAPGGACWGCCGRRCTAEGTCPARACREWLEPCEEAAQCCDGTPCTNNQCRFP